MHPSLETLLAAATAEADAARVSPRKFASAHARVVGEARMARDYAATYGGSRVFALRLFVAECLAWFACWPDLDSVTTTCQVTTRMRVDEKGALRVALHRRVEVTLAGADLADEERPQVDGLLPVELLGPGTFLLLREAEPVQDYLGLADDADALFQGCTWALAEDMAECFGQASILHEVEDPQWPVALR